MAIIRSGPPWRQPTATSILVGPTGNTTTTAAGNTALGVDAGRSNATGFQTAVGYTAGRSNTTGTQTAVGYAAGYSNVTGTQTVIGHAAGFTSTGNNITAIGHEAGKSLTTGNNVTIVGQHVGAAGMADTLILATGSTIRLQYDPTNGYQLPSVSAVAGTITPTHTITLSVGGVKVRIPCVLV